MLKFKLLFAAALLSSTIAFAQTSDQSAPAQSPAPAQPSARQGRHDPVEGRLRNMGKQLNLTDDQKEKIKPLLQQETDQMKSLQADTSLTPQQKRKKAREVHLQYEPQIRALLTPEQKEKLQDMRANGRGRRQWRHGNDTGTTSSSADKSSDKSNSSQKSPDTSDDSDPQ